LSLLFCYCINVEVRTIFEKDYDRHAVASHLHRPGELHGDLLLLPEAARPHAFREP